MSDYQLSVEFKRMGCMVSHNVVLERARFVALVAVALD